MNKLVICYSTIFSLNSQVVSGGDTIGSGNNFNFQSQKNSGNNALGQQ
ncbi:MAG TPA: hypothetical protein VLE21_04270 [Candidatus Nitrosocosmicus sp.]|nr:hypothetical protein [Candidatus Nitrosocosmicus sp.]